LLQRVKVFSKYTDKLLSAAIEPQRKGIKMELNYLCLDVSTQKLYRIYGCTSSNEAKQFIGCGQKLVVLTDDEAQGLDIIEQ